MELVNKKLKELVDSENLDQLSAYLESIDPANVETSIISDLCKLMEKESKGIRNLVTQFFLANRFPCLPECIVDYISSKDITLRNLTGEILIQYDKLSIDPLIKFIDKSNNDFDIKFAADILALIVDPKVEKALFDLLDKTSNDNVIISCIEGFRNNKTEAAVEILKQLYKKKDIFKPYVIDALGKIGNKEAFDFIIDCYNDDDILVKYNVLESLGNIGNEDSFFFLIGELQKADESFVQPILESIYKLQLKYGFDLPYDEKIKRALLILLNQNDVEHIKIAIKFLSPYSDPELIYEMLRHYGIDEEVDSIILEKVRNNTKEVLEIFPQIIASNPLNLSHLLYMLNQLFEYNPELINSIDKFTLHKLIDNVSRNLNHIEEMVRLYSVELLFKLDVDTALMMLDEEFLNANFWIKLRLIEILETINQPSVFEFLAKMAEDENEMIRQKAIEVLNIKNFSFN
ncbi:MAG: HEAT repeat domain-containing protein [Ignavibacterium sp.]|nr:HEAT repeat domain-containing protein [Ignavibacterium sp.]MCX7610848.1 HEAT repeat domain-containing protein [Ignavibacterium sp.]MDW8374629.1 HEAT repeat domain-containing protein [Ignavibacteriales bacterium]